MSSTEETPSATAYRDAQLASLGDSSSEIHIAAVEYARPERGLPWLDIGCGTGAALREIRDRFDPARLVGLDVIDWLEDDLRDDIDLRIGAAESMLERMEPVDRVLMVEVLEHLESPWGFCVRPRAGLLRLGAWW